MANLSLTEPLDLRLAYTFDRAVDAAFELSRMNNDIPWVDEEHRAADALLSRLGLRLLGSQELLDEVMACLGDGPAEGDVLAALSVLWDMDVVDLSPAVLAQVNAPYPADMRRIPSRNV
jgi:hypothetical protein